MIQSKEDYHFYIEADRIAKAMPKQLTIRQKFLNLVFPNYVWKFQLTLRRLEFYKNCKSGILNNFVYMLLFRKFKKLSVKLGFSIPPNVFGPGLSIAHYGTIVVNSNAKIGNNCRLHACVNIGTAAGHSTLAPKIGDNCYIGPGAKIYGEILLGDNTAIGANSVVNLSFPEGNVAIGGVPARKLSDQGAYRLIIPATVILKKGLKQQVDKIISEGGSNLTEDIHNIIAQNQ